MTFILKKLIQRRANIWQRNLARLNAPYLSSLHLTFIETVKNTEHAYTKLMKRKFNMHLLWIEDDLLVYIYDYQKTSLLSLCLKKIFLAFNLLEKMTWFSGRGEGRRSRPKVNSPSPENTPVQNQITLYIERCDKTALTCKLESSQRVPHHQ